MARSVETLLAVFLLGAATAPGKAEPLLREFAICAGRLSATMEDQWMFDGPASERTQGDLQAMLALIQASMAPGEGRKVMDWRIKAKVAHRALLHQARFAQGPARAELAAARAEALAADCRSLLLG